MRHARILDLIGGSAFKQKMTIDTLKTFALLGLILLMTQVAPASAQNESELVLNPDTPDELRINLTDQTLIEIDPQTGNLNISAVTVPDFASGQVSVEPFSPSPAFVEQGESFQVNLNTRGAWTCRRSGLPDSEWLTSDTELVNGTISVRVDTSIDPDNYTLVVECQNAGTIESESATLEVNAASEPDPDLPPACDEVPLPASWTRDTTALSGDSVTSTLSWRDVFGNDFPSGNSTNIGVDRNRFMALEFDPSDLPGNAQGLISFNSFASQPGGDIGNRTPTVSIARCPGDFRKPSFADRACRKVGINTIQWSTDPDASGCELDTTESRYFLNVVYAFPIDEDDPTTWFYSCPDSSDPDRTNFPECGSLITSSSNQ
jgi:hypothetical protein